MKRKPKEQIDYTDWTVEDHIEHLRTHPAYQAYYAQFEAKSVEAFIEEYAAEKYRIFDKIETYKEEYETHQTQYLSDADDYIDMILQKKLFNLQCQWRAEQIDLPLVETCDDFEYWEKHIRACPFIAPITQEEVDLCIRFLNEDIDFHELMYDYPYGCCWQNIEAFRNQLILDENEDRAEDGDVLLELPPYGDYSDLPELYTFFDDEQDTEHLLKLPDIRKEKDRRYLKEAYRLLALEREAEQKANGTWREPEPYVYKPYLFAHGDSLEEFVKAVEDETVKESYKYYQHHFGTAESQDLSEEMQEYFDFLSSCDEPVPMEANDNWFSAVINSVRRFKQKKVAEMLVYAYDTYIMEFDEDQPLDQLIADRVARYEYDEDDEDYQNLMVRKARILDGREALEGVRDFNY